MTQIEFSLLTKFLYFKISALVFVAIEFKGCFTLLDFPSNGVTLPL